MIGITQFKGAHMGPRRRTKFGLVVSVAHFMIEHAELGGGGGAHKK